MTYEMEYVFHLFSCGAQGISAQPPKHDVDWQKVISFARDQSVTYTVGMALKNSQLNCPENIRNRLTASTRGASVKNITVLLQILDILSRMDKAGIHITVLKGISVAKYYANPECRVSSDVDLLVSPNDEKSALKFLSDEGFTVTPRNAQSHHSVCTHPLLGIIELHISLWKNALDDVIFKNFDLKTLPEGDVKSQYLDMDYYELDTMTNLIFLTVHMLKHFIFGGISMRMIMDNALFIKNNLNLIDKNQYSDFLKQTGYYYTMQVILGIAVKYCGFTPEDFPIEASKCDEDIAMLVDDLEKGGWQGRNNEKERNEAWYYYRNNYALSSDKKTKHIFKIILENIRSLLHGFFLPIKQMQKKYPVLKKHKGLYVFCLIHRFFSRGFSALTGKTFKNREMIFNSDNLSDEGLKRVEMFRKFGLFENNK